MNLNIVQRRFRPRSLSPFNKRTPKNSNFERLDSMDSVISSKDRHHPPANEYLLSGPQKGPRRHDWNGSSKRSSLETAPDDLLSSLEGSLTVSTLHKTASQQNWNIKSKSMRNLSNKSKSSRRSKTPCQPGPEISTRIVIDTSKNPVVPSVCTNHQSYTSRYHHDKEVSRNLLGTSAVESEFSANKKRSEDKSYRNSNSRSRKDRRTKSKSPNRMTSRRSKSLSKTKSRSRSERHSPSCWKEAHSSADIAGREAAMNGFVPYASLDDQSVQMDENVPTPTLMVLSKHKKKEKEGRRMCAQLNIPALSRRDSLDDMCVHYECVALWNRTA
mmetsp:Transcript_31940/g.45426  ORF Transcript_31940/g.45426 Transcript_31940/m.45426 type:complete len:329 (-) Transcript_31940:102-1088(-)